MNMISNINTALQMGSASIKTELRKRAMHESSQFMLIKVNKSHTHVHTCIVYTRTHAHTQHTPITTHTHLHTLTHTQTQTHTTPLPHTNVEQKKQAMFFRAVARATSCKVFFQTVIRSQPPQT